MYEIKQIPAFSPEGKLFCFNFTKDTCYERLTGRCALDSHNDAITNKCIRLYNLLLEGVQFDLRISLVKHQCGHYSIGDGQHRICIAGKKGLQVPIRLIESDEVCECCSSDRNWYFMKSF